MGFQYLQLELARNHLRGDSIVLLFETEDIEANGRIKEGDTYSLGMLNLLGSLGWELVSELPLAISKTEKTYDFPARFIATFKKTIK